MKKIFKILTVACTTAVMMSSMTIGASAAYDKEQWTETSGGTYHGYVWTWFNGGITPDYPVQVMGSVSVEAHVKMLRSSKPIRGNMSLTTSVEGAGYGNHNDATNCDSMTVAISGKTYVHQPIITASVNFKSTSGDRGSANFKATVKAE